jgi:hypothetical protein
VSRASVERDNLRRNLKRLDEELAAGQELDPETRALLQRLAGDIERVLAEDLENPPSIREQVEEATVRFEVEHPRLAMIFGDLADTLAKLGL